MRYVYAQNYISQAFSLKGLRLLDYDAYIKVEEISYKDIPKGCVSCIGHEDAAYFISRILNEHYEMNRITNKFQSGDVLYVCLLDVRFKPTKKKDGKKPVKEMAKFFKYLKVTIQGFEGELTETASIINKFTRLAGVYLMSKFTLKTLKLINYNALIRVQKVSKEDIPSNCQTNIGTYEQAKFLTEELGFPVRKGGPNVMLQKGHTLYVATTDYDRPDEDAKPLKKKEYVDHSIYLKVTIQGFEGQTG